MSRQNNAIEYNSFIRGLITEASPLTFPKNASLDERNFVLLRDGSRRRRLGMDIENASTNITTTTKTKLDGNIDVTTFKWVETEDNSQVQVGVVQINNELRFFNLDVTPLSDGLIHTHIYYNDGGSPLFTGPFSYANVDGLLVVATGKKDISIFQYEDGVITHSTDRIKIRDLFGVEDIMDGKDLMEGANISFRPSRTTTNYDPAFDEHIYNLRNQSFGPPRKYNNTEDLWDPIKAFVRDYLDVSFNDGLVTVGDLRTFPSNSDTVSAALFPDSSDDGDRVGDRFWPRSLAGSSNNELAPKGYFIIDALDRGQSRLDALNKMYNNFANPEALYEPRYRVGSLPEDSSTKGATVLESFSGRVWYAGFNNEVENPDSHSPRMASYIMFSQLVDNKKDVTKCYQEADPTSKDDPDLVDTDGGFLRISGADRIVAMKNIGLSLLVFATNGVWSVMGGSDYGFTATNYLVTKITDSGCVGVNSIVEVSGSLMYWSEDGIYLISASEMGQYTASNMTANTIQSLYLDIPNFNKVYCKAHYDKYDRKVRWVYNTIPNNIAPTMELVFDVDLQAFYINEVGKIGSTTYPYVGAVLETSPYSIGSMTDLVTESGNQVTVNGTPVTVTQKVRRFGSRDILYVTILDDSPAVLFNFSKYHTTDFYDWKSVNGIGVNADAYMITGYMPSEDMDKQRFKQVPYLTMHFLRTEDGFTADGSGDLYPDNPSSCLVQAQWDWTDSSASNRWGTQFQAYRYRRLYLPVDSSDDYDTGHRTVVTKNKVRGRGRVVSFYFQTEPGKDCRLLGWSMVMGISGNV